MARGVLKWSAAAMALVMATASLAQTASAQSILDRARAQVEQSIREAGSAEAPQQQVMPTITWNTTQRSDFETAQRTYTATLQGLALGAILGAVVCRQLFEGVVERRACILAMAVVGGALGNRIDRRNQRLVQDRDQVVASLEEARRARDANAQLLAATNDNIGYLEQRIADSERQLQRNRITAAQHQANLAQAREDANVLNRSLETVEQAVAQQTRAYEDLNSRAAAAEDPAVRETQPSVEAELNQNRAFQTQSVAPARTRLTQVRERIGAG